MRRSVGLGRLRGSVRDDLAHLVQVLASSESHAIDVEICYVHLWAESMCERD